MTPALTKIMFGSLWAAFGVLSSWLSFLSLQKQADLIKPNGAAPLTQLIKLMAGRIVQMLLIGGAIYLALRMHVLYAIVFVVALTITTWVLVVNLNRQANKLIDDRH